MIIKPLSPLGYNLLRIVNQKEEFTIDEAAEYLQTTYNSMVKRGYLKYEIVKGKEQVFRRTSLAKEALAAYLNRDVHRANANSSLSQYLEGLIKKGR